MSGLDWALIVIAVIVVLVIGGFLLYYFVFRNSSGDDSDDSKKSGLGVKCANDTDCSSGNCSMDFCQAAGRVTGTVGAACISTDGTISDGGCGSDLECVIESKQTVGTCKSTGNTGYFNKCENTTQCMDVNTCRKTDGSDGSETFCLFPVDPNQCSNGVCLSGFMCTSSECLGEHGMTCNADTQCVSSSCQTSATVVQWDGTTWNSYGIVQSGLSFTRIVATNGAKGDDIWALDPDNGLYYLEGGQAQFQQILSITTQRVVDSSVQGGPDDPNPRNMKLLDFDATTDGEVFVLYVAPSLISGVQTVYPIFTVDTSGKLEPFLSKSGVQAAPIAPTYSVIAEIAVIKGIKSGTGADIKFTTINVAINGKDPGGLIDNFTMSVISSSADDPKLSNSTVTAAVTDTGSPVALGPNNAIRYVMNPKLAGDVIGMNFNTLTPNLDHIQCLSCDSYTGQPSGTTNNIIGESEWEIADYTVTLVNSGLRKFNNTYMIAQNTTGDWNLYLAPGIADGKILIPVGPFSILPGYYDENSRVAANGPNLYVYSEQSCVG
jgi:hypothetical protein